MKVAAYFSDNDIRVEERPTPQVGSGEALIRVRASGICGSDLLGWYRIQKAPCVLGHEVSGEVVAIGADVENIKVGDRIVASHHVPCFQCHYCQLGLETQCDTLRMTSFDPGGFSQFVRLPRMNVQYGTYRIPDHVSDEDASLVEPLACVVRGQNKINVRPPQRVLVIGCGTSGLLHIMLSSVKGCEVIACDPLTNRRELAHHLGARHVLQPSKELSRQIGEITEGRLADVVIVCVANTEATLTALQCVGRGGTVLLFALNEPGQVLSIGMNEIFWQKGATVTSTYAGSPKDHLEAMDLIEKNKTPVHDLISHRFGLSQISEGFRMARKIDESIKVVIDPSF